MPDPKKKKQELPATRQDSLAVYNNALEKEKFYKNNKDYKLVKEDRSDKSQIDFKNPNIVKSLISEIKRKNIRNIYFPGGTNNMGKINDETKKRIGQVTKNTYSAPDFAFNEVDYYYNPKSPRILISDKIKPQGSRTYESVPKLSDISSIPYYDPLAVKPFDLLTEAEKTQRVKKYGRDGVPDSYGKSKTDIRKPNITVGKQVKESENKGMVYNDKLINKPKVKQIVKDTPQVQSIPKLNPVGLQFMNPTLNITIPNIPIQAKIPKSYSIQENINQNFGGSQTNYKVDDINLLPTNDLGPGNTRKITPQFAYGGNLNNNMNSNQLTHFNEGGTHEQNPNGGIPLGNNASVEQGETKKGNYIYSDRLYINEDLVKQFNLPSNIKGKTFANASKVIEKPFKDKNSNPDKATQKEHLDRLKQAQEVLKEQEAKIQQSMLANSQEIPDQMNGEIPEGMEEFVSGEREQFGEGGGWYDNNQPFFTNNPGPVTGPTNVPQQSAQPANSGMNMNMMGSIGAAMGSIGTLLSSNTKKDTFYDSNTARNERTSQQVGTVKDSIGTAIPIAGVFRGIEKAGGGIGKSIGGDTGAGITAAFSPDEAIMGNMQDSDSSTLEKIGGVFNPIGAGINTSRNAKKRQQEMSRQNAINANKVFRDKETVLAYGGYVDPMKKITNDVYNKYHYPLSQGTIDDTDLTTKLSNEYKNEVPLSLKPTGTIASQLNPSARLNKVSEPNKVVVTSSVADPKTLNPSFLKKAGDYFKENQGEMLRLAPVAMNALQLANLKKPGHVSLNRLSNVYKPGYIDEAGIQNRLDSEHRNTINALTNASGGSDAALRASILGTQAARLRARGDAYSSIQQYNNGQDAIAQNFKLGIDQTNLGQSNLQQDINDKNMGNYDTQKSKFIGQIGTDLGNIGKEKVFAKKAGQMFGYDENGKYIITPEGKKSYIEKEDATKNVAAYGGYLRKNKKGY